MSLKAYNEVSLELAYGSIEDEVEKQIKFAIRNAREVGCSFIMVRRSNAGAQSFSVKHILWPEVDELLREIGARGTSK